MSHRLLPLVAGAVLALGGCGGDDRPVAPPSPSAPGSALLEVTDLPDGYTTSPPEAEPEVSAASRASVEGCDALLDYFRDGAGDGGGGRSGSGDGGTVRFEAGGTGPFVAESLPDTGGAPADLTALEELSGSCASFTDTDADGTTTAVNVQPVADFPRLPGIESQSVVQMSARGGTEDAAFALSGYVVAVRIKGVTCTIVHFGQPGVDRAETEIIARAAVVKLGRRQ